MGTEDWREGRRTRPSGSFLQSRSPAPSLAPPGSALTVWRVGKQCRKYSHRRPLLGSWFHCPLGSGRSCLEFPAELALQPSKPAGRHQWCSGAAMAPRA